MTCRELCELLVDYLGGELDEAECQGICAHLKICTQCETFFATYRITVQLGRSLPRASLPPEAETRLLKLLRGCSGASEATP